MFSAVTDEKHLIQKQKLNSHKTPSKLSQPIKKQDDDNHAIIF